MEEYIGKVKLDYEFYKGSDEYSDGDVEEDMLNIVKECQTDEALEERLTHESLWPYLYHFSKLRHNVLDWYDFDKSGTLLEIGAGCGALSGLFCRKTGKVTAVDLSKRRSMINAYRNKSCDNLEILIGNFEDIEFREKYDYVTLIGVLEYSIYYINSENPFEDMLRKVKSLLKPDGKLLLAIENKYGLKYWAGAREDHTGGFFDGIEGYNNVDRVRTFSKKGLTKMLIDSGYAKNEFYYPVPDYKLPLEIYSEGYLPKKGDIKNISPAYDRDRYMFFDEVMAYDSLCEDDMFEEFANSFIVVSC